MDSGSAYVEPEPHGLGHHADPESDTKLVERATKEIRGVLDDLVASLNERLGRGSYDLRVEVLEGEMDLSGLHLPPSRTDRGGRT